eukprot:1939909-Amphidinium_carterae.1
MTSLGHWFYAAVVAFDLDFRKNLEPQLRERLGEPILQLPLHPSLQLKLQVGTTHSSVSVGMGTALDLLQGTGDFSQVVGLVFGLISQVTIPVASVATALETPIISFGATISALSDEAQYPYFLRAVSPDSLQGHAMWMWARWFQVPAFSFLYALKPHPEDLLQSLLDSAAATSAEHVRASMGTLFSKKKGLCVLHR